MLRLRHWLAVALTVLMLESGCTSHQLTPPSPPKYGVGQKVKLAVDGRPAIVVYGKDCGYYGIRYVTDRGEYGFASVREFEIEPAN